jgi:DNA topoisomerase VI subunit A
MQEESDAGGETTGSDGGSSGGVPLEPVPHPLPDPPSDPPVVSPSPPSPPPSPPLSPSSSPSQSSPSKSSTSAETRAGCWSGFPAPASGEPWSWHAVPDSNTSAVPSTMLDGMRRTKLLALALSARAVLAGEVERREARERLGAQRATTTAGHIIGTHHPAADESEARDAESSATEPDPRSQESTLSLSLSLSLSRSGGSESWSMMSIGTVGTTLPTSSPGEAWSEDGGGEDENRSSTGMDHDGTRMLCDDEDRMVLCGGGVPMTEQLPHTKHHLSSSSSSLSSSSYSAAVQQKPRPSAAATTTAAAAPPVASIAGLSTMRDLYYRRVGLFGSASDASLWVRRLCAVVGLPRHALGIAGCPRGEVFGPLEFRDPHRYQTVRADDRREGEALPLSSMAHRWTRVSTGSARFVVVCEKHASFAGLVAARFHRGEVNGFGDAILVTGKGYPDTYTAATVARLSVKEALPTFILTDADPAGLEIAMTFVFGGVAGLAAGGSYGYAPELTTCPSARWVGVTAADVAARVPVEARLNLTPTDRAKLDVLGARCAGMVSAAAANAAAGTTGGTAAGITAADATGRGHAMDPSHLVDVHGRAAAAFATEINAMRASGVKAEIQGIPSLIDYLRSKIATAFRSTEEGAAKVGGRVEYPPGRPIHQ